MTRVLSAAVLLAVVIGVVWRLPPIGTVVLATIAAILAVVEFAAIASAVGAKIPRALVAICVAATCVAVGYGVVALEIVLLVSLVLIGTTVVFTREPGPGVISSAAAAVFALVYIGAPLGALAAIRTLGGYEAVLLLLITIVVSDSAQYYTGRTFGRAPLAPAISPKKTREGAIGGLVFGTAAMVIGGKLVFPAAPPLALAVASLAVVILGFVGDLFESLLKRSAGVKDSSALIPGHGGILDRIDSWLFAGPAYYLFLRYLYS
jgi:phosphatidate cytidylyltransferase